MIVARRKAALDPAAGTRRPTPVDALPQDKPRGFLNFLTWPFILAQFLVVEQALGEGARATVAEDATSDAHYGQTHPDGDDASDRSALPVDKNAAVDAPSQSDDVAAGHADLTPALAAPATGAVFRPDTASPARAADHHLEAPSGGGGGSVTSPHFGACSADAGDSAIGSSEDHGHDIGSAGLLPLAGAAEEAAPPIPGDAFDHMGSIPLPAIYDTATGLACDAVTTAAPIADAALQTVSTTADAVTALADHVLADAAPMADTVLRTVGATADAVTGLANHVVIEAAPVVDTALQTVNATTDAITGLADHLVSAAAPAVDSLPQTLTATTDAVMGLGNHVGADTTPVIDSALQTASTTADIVAGLADHVATDVAPAVHTIPAELATATGLVGDVLAPIDTAPAPADVSANLDTNPNSATHAADSDSLTPAFSTLVSDTIGGLLGATGSGPTAPYPHSDNLLPASDSALGSGGTIAITDQPPSPTAADDLFTAGQYTDYGVTLNNDAATGGTGGVTHTLDQTVAETTAVVDIVHHGATNGALAPTDQQHQDLIHGLDDLALRGGDRLL